jgi:4-aminobutyrate aminotransferase-like enzyme
MINAYDAAHFAELAPADQALIRRREKVLGPVYRLFYERPVHFVRAEGTWLYDADGNAYLDAYNNVASVGHANPKVVEAMARQAALLNTHTRYLDESIIAYAERLTATFPPALSQIVFTCTGSEANDLATRIARHVTGGTGIIVTDLAYHGVTSAVSEYSPSLGQNVAPGAHVRAVRAPDARRANGDVGRQLAGDIEAAVADMREHGINPAMFIADTIFSSDGIFADPAGFLQPAAAAIRAAGGLFVADEVQPGFGRTGAAMWGFERHGVVPDIVTLGKPMGNGYPIAGLAARPELLADFGAKVRYFNTFGGTPVGIAAASAVLDFIQGEGIVGRVADTGSYLRQQLLQLRKRHSAISEVRGSGLFVGVELAPEGVAADGFTTRIVNGMRDRRVLISASGRGANVLKIRPPLVFSRANVDLLVSALDECLAVV